MITVSLLLVFLPVVFSGTVSAQTTGYTITEVDHQVQVLYTGQVIIQDTIHVSGQVTDGFTVGLPAQYSDDVISATAYDSNNVYPVNLGVQLGDKSGFYGASVDFNGQTPSVFTVAFIMSNSLLTQQDSGTFTLNYPAYPGLTQNVGTCNVTLSFPSAPITTAITKSDGTVNADNYTVQNLPAYTYDLASASVQVSNETIQLADITQLNRQVNIGATGQVSVSDTYRLTDNSTIAMNYFLIDVPLDASNIEVKDQTGTPMPITTTTVSNAIQENVTLDTSVSIGQTTSLSATYNLPSATIQGAQYTLNNFKLFPYIDYYVDQATLTFNPPEGATITTTSSSIDSSSSVTRNTFQDTLTLTRDQLTYINYILPQGSSIEFSYSYSPIWTSFRPTIWLSLVAVIGCIGAVVYKKAKPGEKKRVPAKKAKASTSKVTATASTEQVEAEGTKTATATTTQRITGDDIKEFADSYEDRKRLNAEIRSLDQRAQKGKIPRRQYKVQRRAIEVRLEAIARHANKVKQALRDSGAGNADLVKQLDAAEKDLVEAENDIKKLEDQHERSEISIEEYKSNIGDYQKHLDKAESNLNGTLLRLREKVH